MPSSCGSPSPIPVKTIVVALIRLYQMLLSPIIHLVPGSGCRYLPTCSQYAIEAVQTHGIFKGVALGIYRILRCNPWGSSGHDPVPPRRA